MKKLSKLLLVFFGITLLSIDLSGCSNKYNSILHSVKYYTKHVKQRNSILKRCGELTPFELSKHSNSNLVKDCSNAQDAESQWVNPPLPPSNLDLYKTH